MATNGYGSRSNNGSTNGEAVQETDRLQPRTNGYRESQSTETTALVDGNAAEGPRGNHRQSVQSFFFPKENPTIQRYYKFSATPMTPFAALHKRPGAGDAGGVTGLLRRSAVLPSHGTDPSGDWILVSVGGRSGWARRRRKVGDVGNFRMVKDFKAIEGWMGNHIFACGGKLMLGSHSSSLVSSSIWSCFCHRKRILGGSPEVTTTGLPLSLPSWLSFLYGSVPQWTPASFLPCLLRTNPLLRLARLAVRQDTVTARHVTSSDHHGVNTATPATFVSRSLTSKSTTDRVE